MTKKKKKAVKTKKKAILGLNSFVGEIPQFPDYPTTVNTLKNKLEGLIRMSSSVTDNGPGGAVAVPIQQIFTLNIPSNFLVKDFTLERLAISSYPTFEYTVRVYFNGTLIYYVKFNMSEGQIVEFGNFEDTINSNAGTVTVQVNFTLPVGWTAGVHTNIAAITGYAN